MAAHNYPLQKYSGSSTPTVGGPQRMTALQPSKALVVLDDEEVESWSEADKAVLRSLAEGKNDRDLEHRALFKARLEAADLRAKEAEEAVMSEAVMRSMKLSSARRRAPAPPAPVGVSFAEHALRLEKAASEKQITASKPDQDVRRAECWIRRTNEELNDSSDLMKAMRRIDPAQRLKRIRVARKITKLNLKEAAKFVDAMGYRVPTDSKTALETALIVARQRDDLAKGLAESQTELHNYREEIREEVCEELKQELQKRIQARLSQFNKLRRQLNASESRVSAQIDEIMGLKVAVSLAEEAFDAEVENVDKATQQLDILQNELDGLDHKGNEFIEAWETMAFHYRGNMPKNRVFSGLLAMMGQMLGADVHEW